MSVELVADCCGALCDGRNRPDEPCYGTVDVIDEWQYGTDDEPEWAWIHACEGHADWPGKYIPQVKP